MSFVDNVVSPIKEDLEEVEEELSYLVTSKLQPLTDSSLYLLESGGKRLRPSLVLLSGKLFDYKLTRLKPLAIAVELVHMASLIHDDIIDDSNLRRGSPPVNYKWNNKVAVLSGDLLYTFAANSLAELEDSNYLTHLLQATLAMTRGQAYELVDSGDHGVSIDDYLTRVRQKTALLMSKSCLLGARACGGGDGAQAQLEGYGLNVGLAFQIMDDLRDLFGTRENLGKEPGKDLKEGVLTLPIIIAINRSDRRSTIEELLVNEDPSREKINRGIDIIKESGAVEDSLEYSNEYGKKALDYISGMADSPARDSLASLARYLAGDIVEGEAFLKPEVM
ncbi:polyprenyl synthetase family protein [Candidatus Bipolaricaulota bacterium]|nr:polyprenyl synthetase family protein [Candidatus Bipolaricaulota bacterium]